METKSSLGAIHPSELKVFKYSVAYKPHHTGIDSKHLWCIFWGFDPNLQTKKKAIYTETHACFRLNPKLWIHIHKAETRWRNPCLNHFSCCVGKGTNNDKTVQKIHWNPMWTAYVSASENSQNQPTYYQSAKILSHNLTGQKNVIELSYRVAHYNTKHWNPPTGQEG